MTRKSPSLRVLVVDDELLIRWFVGTALEARGHTVIAASDGASARMALAEATQPVDAVLLDYRLSDSQDLGLLADIRRTVPDTAVVMMTTCSTPELCEEALALGVYTVVDKPFEVQDLEATLLEACAL